MVLLFLCFSLVSILFIYAPFSIISFLLLVLGLVYSSFSSSLNCKVRLIWDLCVLMSASSAINFPLYMLSLCLISFDSLCFHFHSSPSIFLISLGISFLSHWLLKTAFLNFHKFVNFSILFLWLIFNCDWRR